MTMNMKNITRKLGVLLLFVASACQLDNDTVNPSTLTPASADPDLLLNAVQLNFGTGFFNGAATNVDVLVRMQAMTGGYRYPTAFTQSSQNFVWQQAYQAVLINTKILIPIAQSKKLTTHVAMAKIFEAYTYLTLVDLYNDVPQSEALLGVKFDPKADNASDVYAYAIGLLNDARTELTKTGTDAGTNIAAGLDIYYGGVRANWVALANSLELKAWLNIRSLPSRAAEADAKITTLLTSNLIDNPDGSENFTFKYGTATVPNSRHPLYDNYYGLAAGTAGGFLSNYYMNELFSGNGVQDPRWRYYFYRQVGSVDPIKAGFDPKALGCSAGAIPQHYVSAGAVFCNFEPGFYGRDHGDASGVNPVGPVLTCTGIYPAGGRPDNNTAVSPTPYNVPAKRGDGANGAGIEPIFMSFFTDFMKAEILGRRGDVAGARAALNTAIINSIDFTKKFADGKVQSVTILPWSSTAWVKALGVPMDGVNINCGTAPNPITPAYQQCRFNQLVNNYLNAALAKFDAASSKLDVIGREFYISINGNGLEAYNLYRRTGAPRNLQPTVQLGAGVWTRAMPYPATFSTLAGGAVKDNESVNKVFWDGNPETLN